MNKYERARKTIDDCLEKINKKLDPYNRKTEEPREMPVLIGLFGHFWCPFCRRFHRHCPPAGSRMPHCCGKMDDNGKDITIKNSNPFTSENQYYVYPIPSNILLKLAEAIKTLNS
jgi:hypothetical protein